MERTQHCIHHIHMQDKHKQLLDWIDQFIESQVFVATCVLAEKSDNKQREFLDQFDTYCRSLIFHMQDDTPNTHRIGQEIENIGAHVATYLMECDASGIFNDLE